MAVVTVRIPTPLQKLTGGNGEVTANGATVKDVIDDMEANYPTIKERLYSEEGELRRFINIYINDEDIRFLDSDNSKVADGDVISVIPAIAGGACSFGSIAALGCTVRQAGAPVIPNN